jgi:hypothetical protein
MWGGTRKWLSNFLSVEVIGEDGLDFVEELHPSPGIRFAFLRCLQGASQDQGVKDSAREDV